MNHTTKGRSLSEAHKQKLRVALKGNKNSLGFIPSLESRKKMSLSKRGELSPKWRGGKRAFLREEALRRDNYTCRDCGLREVESAFMDVNHIIPVKVDSSLKFNLNNLETLCPNCHRRKTMKIVWTKGWKYRHH